jgi:hypothetical protein
MPERLRLLEQQKTALRCLHASNRAAELIVSLVRMKATKKFILLTLLLTAGVPWLTPAALAATCTTQSQMTAAQRDSLAGAARKLAGMVQRGDVAAAKADTLPAVAANFDGIAASITALHPDVAQATIVVYDLYALDASTEPAGGGQTDFYCGSPVVVLNFTGLPPGKYGLAIVHATGVPKPQQMALIFSETAPNQWQLAGFVAKPMTQAGHDGLWYWTQGRSYAQKKMNWNAWFYLQTAAALLNPADFVASPNLGKLQQEADKVRPAGIPAGQPITLTADGQTYSITGLTPAAEFGPLDLAIDYAPNPTQAAQLRDPVAARRQAVAIMQGLLTEHPELREAFHGLWVRADANNAMIYSLELPMNQITPATPQAGAAAAH